MALTGDRLTKHRDGNRRYVPVKTGETIYNGAQVALDGDGLAVAGKTATGLVTIGVADERIENAVAGSYINVRCGVFLMENSADTEAVSTADIGKDCYMVDDATVAKTNGTNTRSAAGKVFDVDSDGVWVKY